MPRVLVVGSANVDYVVAVSRLPRPGETISGGTLLVNRGGKGANQAVAARRLGAEVRFVACVGEDAPGREMVAALADEGIAVDGIATTSESATGAALIVVDAEGRNQIAVAPGANRRLTPEHVRRRREDVVWAEIVVTQLETPLDTVRWVLEEARRSGATTILNPAPVPDSALDCWPFVDYLTPNEGEAARLTGVAIRGRADVERAGAALRSLGVGTAIVTLGGEGVLACTADGSHHGPAVRVEVVDTTAAGDAFNGALAVGLAERRGLDAAIRLASAAAALACTRRGAQASLPTRAEVDALLGS